MVCTLLRLRRAAGRLDQTSAGRAQSSPCLLRISYETGRDVTRTGIPRANQSQSVQSGGRSEYREIRRGELSLLYLAGEAFVNDQRLSTNMESLPQAAVRHPAV